MAFSLEEIEYYHDIGLMPDWAYYQQNGKTAEENYRIWRNKRSQEFRNRIIEERYNKSVSIEDEVKNQIEAILPELLDKALDEILGELNTK